MKQSKTNQPTAGASNSVNLKQFTQLLDFSSTPEKIAEFANDFKYLCILYTNTRYRAKEIPAAIDFLAKQFRYILNNQVRYQQRQDNLPPAYGVRFFQVTNSHYIWKNVQLCLFCSNVEVLQFIVRCWCDRFQLYPHTLSATFERESHAVKYMPSKRKTDTEYFQNCTIKRVGNIIYEEYYFSNPFRLSNYIRYEECNNVMFGNAATILKAKQVYFMDSKSVRLSPFSYNFDGIYCAKGRRDYQAFGNYKTTVNTNTKKRIIHANSNDSKAKTYYRTTILSGAKFNPFIYQRLKQQQTMYSNQAHLNQFIIDKLMDTLRTAVEEIEYLRQVINPQTDQIESSDAM